MLLVDEVDTRAQLYRKVSAKKLSMFSLNERNYLKKVDCAVGGMSCKDCGVEFRSWCSNVRFRRWLGWEVNYSQEKKVRLVFGRICVVVGKQVKMTE
jgi:hypothetical protein